MSVPVGLHPCNRKHRFVFLVLALLVFQIVGCSGGGNTTTGAPPTPPQPAVTVTVSGNSQVRLGSTSQLSAAVANTSNTAVTWEVNGTPNGSAATGTISSGGLYAPPSSIPSSNTVTITAVSKANTAVSGSITESILNPIPVVASASATGLSPNYTLAVTGTGFVMGAQVELQGSPLPTTFVSGTQLTATANIALPADATTLPLVVVNPDPGSMGSNSFNAVFSHATAMAAARLLDQSSFGPTLADIQNVQNIGLSAYLNQQFQTPTTTLALFPATPPTACTKTLVPCLQSEWWQATLTAPDQLRQRVAFALAEMFVISTDTDNPRAVVAFQNTLANDAFTNFSTIMNDVTLSPGMGAYLNMLNSNKPGTVNGVVQIANENYSRELMQLFTLGLNLLNPDGTPQLDSSGKPMPTYTQDQVQAFARAYTGWTYANSTGGTPSRFPNGAANFTMPLAAVESAHDTGAKNLLNGTTLPAGQTAEQDLAGALQNIFNHPNAGPFVCRQLIQHLVASNPSPAYVARVAAVFENNGSGVRGDMQAVITAILLDQEARAGDTDPIVEGGHLREPVLWFADLLRGLGFTNKDTVAGNDIVANASFSTLGNYTSALGQKPYASPSVFNFFPPEYVIPGTPTNAPEFGLENTASAILRLSLANSIVFNRISGFSGDLSATSSLGVLASNPGNLVDTLSTLFLHSQMSSDMRSAIINNITPLTDMGERVRVATYLVVTSAQYKIEH